MAFRSAIGEHPCFKLISAQADSISPAGGVPSQVAADAKASSSTLVVRLLLASSLMLFLELALIRWLGANVIHLSYFSNFVLLGSFLGIGAGFLISRKSWSIWPASMPLLSILVVGVLWFPVTITNSPDRVRRHLFHLARNQRPARLARTAGHFRDGRRHRGRAGRSRRSLFRQTASADGIPLRSDRIVCRYPRRVHGAELSASAVGGLGFHRLHPLSGAGQPVPPACDLRLGGDAGRQAAAGDAGSRRRSRSPYYKVATREVDVAGQNMLIIGVNGVPHQLMAPAKWKSEEAEGIYRTPYLRLPGNSLDDVLIIGAGSGSDVAIALSKQARHVDAVDIDPRILQIGVEKNPDRPYADKRATMHTNDGRAFLESTSRKYDLHLFALPYSPTLVSGASQIRLELIPFTQEALASVREHLKPHGAFAMYNAYRERWLIDRLAGTAAAAFGHAPCVDTFDGVQAVITIGMTTADQRCETTWTPDFAGRRDCSGNRQFAVSLLQGRLVPCALYDYAARRSPDVPRHRTHAGRAAAGDAPLCRPVFHGGGVPAAGYAIMSATFAPLSGTTWFVNALVFASVLVIVLAAVETTRKFRTPSLPIVYAGIAASLALAWVIRPEWLLPLPFVPRLLAASLLAFLPIYLANVAFSKRFQNSSDSQLAFAINLMGAIVGGSCPVHAGADDRLQQSADRDRPALPRGFPPDAQGPPRVPDERCPSRRRRGGAAKNFEGEVRPRSTRAGRLAPALNTSGNHTAVESTGRFPVPAH